LASVPITGRPTQSGLAGTPALGQGGILVRVGGPPEVWFTPRLRLRPPRLEDAQVIFDRWAQDAEVTRYLTWRPHTTLAETEALVQRCEAAWTGGQRLPWVMTLADVDEPIGMIELRRDGFMASLGYLLARSAWGHGYMTEAVGEVAAQWLALPGSWRLWAVCDVDNAASARVLERAGLEREGRLRRYVVHPNISLDPRDVYLYAKVRD
jgi:RimJ/RimL family protein N-acetyltransferase